MWSLALKTLLTDRGKLLTALVGVVFAVTLVNIQGGLYFGLLRKASMLVDCGQAHIWVGHRNIKNVDLPSDIPQRWIERVRGIPGVRRAEPYVIGVSEMTLPSGGFEGVVVVGVDPSHMLGNAWNVREGQPRSLLQTDGIFVDASELEKLESPRVGDTREIGGRRARVTGITHGISGFLVMPYVFSTIERARAYLRKPSDVCSYFLVQTAPGVDLEEVCRAIRQRCPQLDAYTKTDYSGLTNSYWRDRTGLGISFGASTLLGLLVGTIMVAQTLYAMVLDRLSEFGTLKALGASEWQVFTLVVLQAVSMALVGSVIGLGIVALIQGLFDTPRAPIVIAGWLSIGSCLLVLTVCVAASLLPYVRIRKVDPVMVLQS